MARLNRTMSASMRRKAERVRFRGWAKVVAGDELHHSIPAVSSDTLKLMSLGREHHAQFAEEPGEDGVVALVVHDEPGVDTVLVLAETHGHCIGVTAGPVVCLEDRYVVTVPQEVGASESGHSGADDGDSHVR